MLRGVWQRSYLTTLTLLGEDAPGTYAETADSAAFLRELASHDNRQAKARVLAREATAILVDVGALSFSGIG